MTDLSDTIAPNADQLTADDLLGGPRTIRITKVSKISGDQPIAVSFEGDGGKPYKPGKSMRRVLVHVWGKDGASYVGRSLTLYRDDAVMFGGLQVGGIRISHMSDLPERLAVALTATKGKKKPFVVNPLRQAAPATGQNRQAPEQGTADGVAANLLAHITAAADLAALEKLTADPRVVERRARLAEKRPDLAKQVDDAVASALDTLDDFPGTASSADSEAA